jgi:excinuclease ABC subunit A
LRFRVVLTRFRCYSSNLRNVVSRVDWIIDLGPDGGDKGGEIVVVGTPETVAEHPTSHTGRYLKEVLKQHPPEVVAS